MTGRTNQNAAPPARTWPGPTRDISEMRHRLTILEARTADPLEPQPLRDRAAVQASQVRDIISRHQATRPPAGDKDKEVPDGRQGT